MVAEPASRKSKNTQTPPCGSCFAKKHKRGESNTSKSQPVIHRLSNAIFAKTAKTHPEDICCE